LQLKALQLLLLSLYAIEGMAQVDSVIHTLQRVDVVAVRHTDAVRATVPVQHIDRDAMTRMGMHSMTDALKHMAGLSVRDYGGAGGMKTVSVRGIGARHTAVVYDGIALSDCQTGEIDLSRYSLDHLSSVSLVIGDDDNIFQPARNQAAAATLRLVTECQSNTVTEYQGGKEFVDRDVTLLPSHFVTLLNVGSFGLVNPSFRLDLPSLLGKDGGWLSFSAIGEFFHADNDYPFTLQNITLTTRERRTNSRMNTWHGELNADWQLNANNILSGKVYYYGSNRRLPGIVHYYTNENHERLCDVNAFGQLRFRSTLTYRLALLVNAKYNWSHTDYQNRTPGSGIGDAKYWQREAYGSASLLYAPTSWLSLDYALDVQENSLNSTLSLYDAHPHRTLLLQCLAAKAQWQRLTLVARGLYHLSWSRSSNSSSTSSSSGSSRETSSSYSSLAPSLSASYQLLPGKEFYLRLMGKQIFRLPTFNELYFYHIGASALRPERASQFDVGVTWESGGRLSGATSASPLHLSLTADMYVNRVTDKIVAVPFNMFVWRIMNLDRATIVGADVVGDVSWRLSNSHMLALNANYSWQRAMNSTVRVSPIYHFQLPYVPQHSLCATLSWENPWVCASVTNSVQSCRWTTVEHTEGTRMPGFGVTDLSFWRSFSLPTWVSRSGAPITLRFTMQNLFDRQYAIVAHYPMPGRSWRMQLVFPI
jgi:outer membrane receptor protein involved in Fe transport